MSNLKIPNAPNSIQKGVPLKLLLDVEAITQLGENLQIVYTAFDKKNFIKNAMKNIEDLTLTERSRHISETMKKFLPENYSEAVEIILKSLTPPLIETEGNGLATMFYMPHCNYIAKYGLEHFDISIKAQYELTKRFTCEFSIRPFIINDEDRTMKVLYQWMKDPDPHVRRLTSEGTRPRLPWAMKIDSFVKNPTPSLLILEELKKLVGTKIPVMVISADIKEEKLIFSEKVTEADKIEELVSKYKIGDIVEGSITGIVDFGVFIKLE